LRRFLALSPRAEAYDLKMEERRLNPHHHVRKIVALSDIDDPQTVARALSNSNFGDYDVSRLGAA